MRAHLAAALCVTVLLGVAACSSDEATTTPLAASPLPSSSPSPSRSATPSPSPSPSPLSPFEDDPAVQAFRSYLAVSSEAINAQDLARPDFAALATAARSSRHVELYTEDLGDFYPGPPPAAVLAVRAVSDTAKVISACLLDAGFALDGPQGSPTAARNVGPALIEMVREGEVWKVDRFLRDPEGSCDGVALPGDPG